MRSKDRNGLLTNNKIMLHSKFNTSFDLTERSVTIHITYRVNGENHYLSPWFLFDDQGKLIIDDNRVLKDCFKYIARHIKTTMSKLQQYLEKGYQEYQEEWLMNYDHLETIKQTLND
tara:strand:- start:12589 stop:12939 length:351 start_codon:yes stop_codon:yes gene_type:complete